MMSWAFGPIWRTVLGGGEVICTEPTRVSALAFYEKGILQCLCLAENGIHVYYIHVKIIIIIIMKKTKNNERCFREKEISEFVANQQSL